MPLPFLSNTSNDNLYCTEKTPIQHSHVELMVMHPTWFFLVALPIVKTNDDYIP
jgi:hypothetical protein